MKLLMKWVYRAYQFWRSSIHISNPCTAGSFSSFLRLYSVLNIAMFKLKHVEKLFFVAAIELLVLGNMAIDRCPELLSCWIDVFITSENGDFITVGFSDGKQRESKLFENDFSSLDLNISYLHITAIFNFYNFFKNLSSSGWKLPACA